MVVYLSLSNKKFDKFFQGVQRADTFQQFGYLISSFKVDICVVNIAGQENAMHILKNIRTQYPGVIVIALMDNAQFDFSIRECYDMGVIDCIPEHHIDKVLKTMLEREMHNSEYKQSQHKLQRFSDALQKAVYAIDYPYIVAVDDQVYKSRLAIEFDAESCIKKEGFFVIESDKWIKEIKNGDKISVIISQGVSDDFNVIKERGLDGITILKFIKIKKQIVRAAEDSAVYETLKTIKECEFTIVHKGLVINGKFSVISRDDDANTIYAEIPKQYLTSINAISKDGAVIIAEGKPVRCDLSIERGMLALKNFSFASLTFKKRENLRVEPSKKIIVTVTIDDFLFEGAIIDISLKSVAIYTDANIKKISPRQNVNISFTLAGEKIETEAILFKVDRISEDSHYMHKIPNCYEANKYFAAVINYNLGAKEREAVNRYLSFRQSEIVAEIKNTHI